MVEDKPLPVIWTHTRYHRARKQGDGVDHLVKWMSRDGWQLQKVISYGYVVAVVDARGSGASFGERRDWFPPEEAHDAYDITEWLAAQSWSDGQIGMFGRSYLGITQYFAAAEQPPHLKAIFPEMSFTDGYREAWPGGMYAGRAFEIWDWMNHQRDMPEKVQPVDDDPAGHQVKQAMAMHYQDWDLIEELRSAPFRDSLDSSGAMFHIERSPINRYEDINASGVAVYHLTGWFDGFTSGPIIMYANLTVPQRMLIGPWFHGEFGGLAIDNEYLRWFDYWLKCIDNGIMDEPAIHYWTLGARQGQQWRSTDRWPLPAQQLTDFYFAAGPAGTVASAK